MRRKKIIPLFIGFSLLIPAGLPAQSSSAQQRIEQPVQQSIDISPWPDQPVLPKPGSQTLRLLQRG
jgi:hypothetical protein